MTIPIVPSRSLLSSSHFSTFSKQPYNGRHASEKGSLFRNVLFPVARMNHETIQFPLLINKYHPPTSPQSPRDVRITVWGVKLQNYSRVTTHVCRPVLYFEECILLMYSNLGSSTGQGRGRRLNGGSGCKARPVVRVAVWPRPRDGITHKLEVALHPSGLAHCLPIVISPILLELLIPDFRPP